MRATPNYDVLKEPRGFIKGLEIFLAIFAFSCLSGFRGEIEIKQFYTNKTESPTPSTSNHPAVAEFSYPFESITLNTFNSKWSHEPTLILKDGRSSPEFFMVVAVFCFLYSLGTLVYYILILEDQPSTAKFSPSVIDFMVGCFWAFFWFCAACALASAVHAIKEATDVELIVKNSEYCKGVLSCTPDKAAKFATLTVAILLGFTNCFVWAGNCWFLWKETPWHSANKQQQPATVPGPTPSPFPQQVAPPAAAI